MKTKIEVILDWDEFFISLHDSTLFPSIEDIDKVEAKVNLKDRTITLTTTSAN